MDHTRVIKKAVDPIAKYEKAMVFKYLRRSCLFLIAVMASAVLVIDTDVILAQEEKPSNSPASAEQQSTTSDEQAPVKGYPIRNRRIGGPTDIEWDLNNSFPKSGSVLELLLRCKKTPEDDRR